MQTIGKSDPLTFVHCKENTVLMSFPVKNLICLQFVTDSSSFFISYVSIVLYFKLFEDFVTHLVLYILLHYCCTTHLKYNLFHKDIQ